ncbi:MAG: hypothetical protein ACR2OR_09610 [Hyphomicrobiales bacterium]
MKAFVMAMIAMAVIGVGASMVLNKMSSWSSQQAFASNSVRIN